jgi:hypothetical protein
MRFRPANIRLINRRTNLPWLLLALPSNNGKSNNNDKNSPIDVQALTGSLHIRAFSTQVLTKCWVPHPFRVLCGMGGIAQLFISTVNNRTESALQQAVSVCLCGEVCNPSGAKVSA